MAVRARIGNHAVSFKQGKAKQKRLDMTEAKESVLRSRADVLRFVRSETGFKLYLGGRELTKELSNLLAARGVYLFAGPSIKQFSEFARQVSIFVGRKLDWKLG